jgi:hypothetical protein
MRLSDIAESELKELKHRKIDLTDKDAPEIITFEESIVGKFYRPIKKQITLRIDADVLEWFKNATGKYQTLINQACRDYMLDHKTAPKNHKS